MELRLNGDSPLPTDKTEAATVLVFDTGPLTHFAKENWLGVLKAVVGKRRAVVPDVVMDELQQAGVRDSRVSAVLQALKPTLALLCEAIGKGLLTVSLVSALADDLSASQYRLPFRAGGFERWAKENGLFQ